MFKRHCDPDFQKKQPSSEPQGGLAVAIVHFVDTQSIKAGETMTSPAATGSLVSRSQLLVLSHLLLSYLVLLDRLSGWAFGSGAKSVQKSKVAPSALHRKCNGRMVRQWSANMQSVTLNSTCSCEKPNEIWRLLGQGFVSPVKIRTAKSWKTAMVPGDSGRKWLTHTKTMGEVWGCHFVSERPQFSLKPLANSTCFCTLNWPKKCQSTK